MARTEKAMERVEALRRSWRKRKTILRCGWRTIEIPIGQPFRNRLLFVPRSQSRGLKRSSDQDDLRHKLNKMSLTPSESGSKTTEEEYATTPLPANIDVPNIR